MASFGDTTIGASGSRVQALPLNPDFQPKKKKQRTKPRSSDCLLCFVDRVSISIVLFCRASMVPACRHWYGETRWYPVVHAARHAKGLHSSCAAHDWPSFCSVVVLVGRNGMDL